MECFCHTLINRLVMWFCMKRVKSDLVGKEVGLFDERNISSSFSSCVNRFITLDAPMAGDKVTERGIEDRVARRVWTRMITRWKEYTLEMAARAGRESAMIIKDCDGREGVERIFIRH